MLKDKELSLSRAKSIGITLLNLSAALAKAENLEEAYAACHYLGFKTEQLSELFDRVPQELLGYKGNICEFPILAIVEERGSDWIQSEAAAGHFDPILGREHN